MPKSKDNLEKKLVEWLRSQGYPLEMRVAQAYQKADFAVSLSDFYKDFETDQSREIDVTAVRWSNFDQPVVMQVCYRVECKRISDKPWIVFVSQAQPEQLLPFHIISSKISRAFLFEALRKSDMRSKIYQLPLLKPRYVGHGVTQAFTSGQDNAYKAVMSAAKAAIDRATGIDELPRTDLESDYCGVVFPIVVVEGRLFECFTNDTGEISIREVNSSVLDWKSSDPTYSSSHIHVVTVSALNELVDHASKTADGLISCAEELMPELASIASRS